MRTSSKHALVGCAAGLVLASSSFASITTVGVLNPTPGGQTIQDSPANVGNAHFVTRSTMGTLLSTAFANNTGGVINFDTANGWVQGSNALAFTVSYGPTPSQLLTLTRADGGGNNTFGPSNSGSPVTSGDGFLGFQTSSSPMTLTFDQGLTAWGITQLNRFGSRTVTMSFTLADNSVINYAAQTQDPNSDNTGALNWYGFQATAANPLTKVTITSNDGFTRFDDMAFVVVPEPNTTLGAMGLIGLLGCRRRRRISRAMKAALA